MRLILLTAAAAVTTLVFTSWAADAAPRRHAGHRAGPRYRVAERYHAAPRSTTSTRITVRRERSFLDPGTEVVPRSQGYLTYAFPPLDYPSTVYDIGNMRRYPLPGSTSGEIVGLYPFYQ